MGTGSVKVLAGGLNYLDSKGNPRQIRLSHTAETYIAALAVDLVAGHCELWQLPPSLLEFHTYAWAQGHSSRQGEVDRLNWQADLWYFCANNPGKRPNDYYSHQTARLWDEASR